MINETSSEYRELLNSLESYNSHLSKNLGKINRIDGWMERSSEEAPYNGEGSLVYFKYQNQNDKSKTYYYVLTDNEVIRLYQFILSKIVSRLHTVKRSFDSYTSAPLLKKMSHQSEDTHWWVEVHIKEHYGVKDERVNNFTHLNTFGGLTAENLDKDLDQIENRGINFCQFIAEQCMLALDQERRIA